MPREGTHTNGPFVLVLRARGAARRTMDWLWPRTAREPGGGQPAKLRSHVALPQCAALTPHPTAVGRAVSLDKIVLWVAVPET